MKSDTTSVGDDKDIDDSIETGNVLCYDAHLISLVKEIFQQSLVDLNSDNTISSKSLSFVRYVPMKLIEYGLCKALSNSLRVFTSISFDQISSNDREVLHRILDLSKIILSCGLNLVHNHHNKLDTQVYTAQDRSVVLSEIDKILKFYQPFQDIVTNLIQSMSRLSLLTVDITISINEEISIQTIQENLCSCFSMIFELFPEITSNKVVSVSSSQVQNPNPNQNQFKSDIRSIVYSEPDQINNINSLSTVLESNQVRVPVKHTS
jgi:hypothetical protein